MTKNHDESINFQNKSITTSYKLQKLNGSSILKWCKTKKMAYFEVSALDQTNLDFFKKNLITTLIANQKRKTNIQ